MTASQGVEMYLLGPARAGRLSCEAVEEAIELASNHAPSSACSRAQEWWRAHESPSQMAALQFSKGIRWLAMLRRDGEMERFTTVCHQLLLMTRLP